MKKIRVSGGEEEKKTEAKKNGENGGHEEKVERVKERNGETEVVCGSESGRL